MTSKLVKKRLYYITRTSQVLSWSREELATLKKAELIFKKHGFVLTALKG